MESKLIVYTVLAITLGYVFVSTIPAQLAPSQFLRVQPESDAIRSPDTEEPQAGAEDTLEQLGEDVAALADSMSPAEAAGDAAKASSDEDKTAASGLTSYSTVFGTLIVNLSIAFAVYLIARRRLN